MRKLLSVAVVLSVSACAGPASNEALRVYATHRIGRPLNQVIDAFEDESGLNVNIVPGCVRPVILPLVKRNRDGDVLILGSRTELKLAEEAGVVESVETIAWNPFVIVVKKGNPLNVQSPEDLKKPGVRLVLPNPGDGCASRLSDEIVTKCGLAEQALVALRKDMKCHTTVGLNLVAEGKVHATFTWRIVAAKAEGIDIVPIPKEKGAPCECFAVTLTSARNAEAAANFVEFLKSDRAQAIFRESGLLDRNEKAADERLSPAPGSAE